MVLIIVTKCQGLCRHVCYTKYDTVFGLKGHLQTLNLYTTYLPWMYWSCVVFELLTQRSLEKNICKGYTTVLSNELLNSWKTQWDPVGELSNVDQRMFQWGSRQKETKHGKTTSFNLDTHTDVRLRRFRRMIWTSTRTRGDCVSLLWKQLL